MQIQLNPKNAFTTLLVIAFVGLAYLIWSREEQPLSLEVDLRDIIGHVVLAVKAGGNAVVKIHQENDLKSGFKGQTMDVGGREPLTRADIISNHLMLEMLERPSLLKVVSEEKSEQLTDKEVRKYRSDNYDLWLGVKEMLGHLPSRKTTSRKITIWIDPLDATQEFTEHLTEYVTVMGCVAIDGQAVFGVIYRPFFNETGLRNYGVINSSSNPLLAASMKHPETAEPRTMIISRSHAGQVRELLGRAFPQERIRIIEAGGAGYKILSLLRGSADLYIHSTNVKKWDLCAGDAIVHAAGGALLDLDGRPLDYDSMFEPVHRTGVLASLINPYSSLAKIRKEFRVEN